MPQPSPSTRHEGRRHRSHWLLVLFAFSLIVAACSDDNAATSSGDRETAEEPADSEAGPGGFPLTIESSAGTFTLESAPQRIVSLSPSATEMLFAIGAGEQVVAVDSFSYYPEEAPVTDLSAFDPNIEAIAAFEPDLVVIAYDANDLVAGLTALDIPVLASEAPIDIESGYTTFADLGLAVGRVDETAAAIATMRAEMTEALAIANADLKVYHELDETFFSASSFGFVGSVYAELGMRNIADEADADQTGFPQLSQEYIVEANPDIIVITDAGATTPETVTARAGWDQISAVANGNVVLVDDDIASRWGPRLPQLVRTIAEALVAAGVSA